MKRTLTLVILLCGGAALGAAPFSHRLHLELRPDCISCHAAAPASESKAGNLMPRKEACQPCHEDRAIRPPSETRLARFNHALHLKMGNIAPVIAAAIDKGGYLQPAGEIRRHLNTTNACVACHRGLAESDQVTHRAFPQMADCLVCHNQIQPPFSCERCHANDPNLRPASHNANFMDAHSSGKLGLDKTTCIVCHGREFTCMGCH